MIRLRLVACAAFLLFSSVARGEAQGQRITTLQPGDTIKVWAVQPRLNGELGAFGALHADTLTLRTLPMAPDAMVRAQVPWAALRRIDVLHGKHRSTGRIVGGVVLGAAAGMLLGAVIGPVVECGGSCSDNGDWAGLGGFVLGSMVGIVGGGITGGVIGGRPRPRWEPVDLRR